MTKKQILATLLEAEKKCHEYLQLKLISMDYRGAIVVLTEILEIRAQLSSISAEFAPDPIPAEPAPSENA